MQDDGATRARERGYLSKRPGLAQLVRALRDGGHTVVAPVVRDDVVCLAAIESGDEIARGVTAEQDAGQYRLIPAGPQDDEFAYVVGPHSPKSWLLPPRLEVLSIRVEEPDGFYVESASPIPPRYAFLGLRPCDLAAIAVQDVVFDAAPGQPQGFRCAAETYYRTAREQAMLIIINCTRPGGTCFCASWDTGPAVGGGAGYDLAMTELRDGFLIDIGSDRGDQLLDRLPVRPPTSAEVELAELKLARAAARMGRWMEVKGLKALLDAAIEHPAWDRIAARCLACGSCTMVCPTCFCSTVTDTSDLSGRRVTRVRQHESCFTHQFSYTTGGPVRSGIRPRYRHWLRHKLCTWWDQFGTSGCVGCGRCITWCPVGIDLTAEIAAMRRSPQPAGAGVEEVPT